MLSHTKAVELGLLGEANTNDVAAEPRIRWRIINSVLSITNKGYWSRDRRHDLQAGLPPTSDFPIQLMGQIELFEMPKVVCWVLTAPVSHARSLNTHDSALIVDCSHLMQKTNLTGLDFVHDLHAGH